MKPKLIRTKVLLIGASGFLTLGAVVGISAAAPAAMAAPSVTAPAAPDPGDTVEAVEGPEVNAGPKIDSPAGHAGAAGASVDNQHQGEGESDG